MVVVQEPTIGSRLSAQLLLQPGVKTRSHTHGLGLRLTEWAWTALRGRAMDPCFARCYPEARAGKQRM